MTASDIIERLQAQLPELEHGQETHRQWRDCDQKYRDQNPDIGGVDHHDKMVRVYQDRIDVINAAIAELSAEREKQQKDKREKQFWRNAAITQQERAERAEAAAWRQATAELFDALGLGLYREAPETLSWEQILGVVRNRLDTAAESRVREAAEQLRRESDQKARQHKGDEHE